MGTYVSQSDIVPAYMSESELIQLTQDTAGTETVDTNTLAAVITAAEAEVDGYLGARYSLPFSSVPQLVTELAARCTVWRLYRRRNLVPPEALKDDYVDLVRTLRDISKGVVTLGEQPEPSPNEERTVRSTQRDRVFGRGNMDGF